MGKLKDVNRRTDNTMAKRKITNNDLQNTTQKNKDRATRNPLKTGGLGLLFLFDITIT